MGEQYCVGIDLGGTNVHSGVVTTDGRLLGRDHRPTEARRGYNEPLNQIFGSVRAAIELSGLTVSDVSGVGIGAPGPLDPYTGTVHSPLSFPHWGDVPLLEIVTGNLGGMRGALDNDANMVAYGENWLGTGKDARNFLCMTLGTGVGGGVVCEGRLLHGVDGNAAEIGHMCIDCNGPRCRCGGVGCLQLYCSATAIAARTAAAMGDEAPDTIVRRDDLSARSIAEAARSGDRFARRMYDETGFFLGMGICSAAALYDCEVVAIGGGMAHAGELIFGPTRRTFRKYGYPSLRHKMRIEPVMLGDDAAVLGAAKLAMDGGVRR